MLAIAVPTCVASVILAANTNRDTQESRPFIYGHEDVTRFLAKRQFSVEAIDTVKRNASADELFVFLSGPSSNGYEALRITTKGIMRITSPGQRAFPATNGHFAAWFSESGRKVIFRNGQSFELPKFAWFDVDPSGRYFIVGREPTRTWLGRTTSAQEQQLISGDMLGSSVFAKGGQIYACGIMDTNKPSGHRTTAAVCLVVEDDGTTFKIIKRHVFEWADGIRDMDPFSNRLLLWDKREINTGVYVFDLATNKVRRLGMAKGFELFLRADLLGKD